LLIEELLVLLEDTKVDSFLTRVIVQFISDYPYFFNDEAQQLVNEALETDPLNSDLLLAQANLYRISGQPEQARQPLLTALKLDSQNPNIPSTIGRLYLEQYEFAQGLDWLRKAAELDPADLELLFQIALSFHLLDFPEQGNTWLEKMRAVDAGSCLIKRIEVVSADREGDRERVIQMTARDLGLVIRQPQFCYFPVDYYAWNMSSSGRTDEAIEYLASLHPDISDLSRLIKDNRRAGYIQQVRLWLLSELMDPADYREIYTAYEEILFKEYPEYFQMAAGVYRITQLDLGGNRPGAVVMFSSWYAGPKFYDDIRRWDQLLSFPWLEGFRSEPEVAEIIAQYRERFTGYREEVSLMLEGEEWKNSGH
jgi:tetratricopeptide (TPR) repeat protein